MIDVNLVPVHLMKKKQKASGAEGSVFPKEMIVGLCGGLVFILLMVVVGLQVLITTKYKEHKVLKAQWEVIAPDKKKADVVTNKLRSLQAKLKSVNNLVQEIKHLSWSQKFNELSDSLPRGVWLKKVAFDGKIVFIEGSAVSKVGDEMKNAHRFAAQLKEDTKFLNQLNNFEIGSIQRRKIKTIDIADFSIKARIR